MISNIEFQRFRGFERLRADLSPNAYIVGPNSAGKSTILEAIALAEHCLQRARRSAPTLRLVYHADVWKTYPLEGDSGADDDPVRFDFGADEARVTIQWNEDARIHVVWP